MFTGLVEKTGRVRSLSAGETGGRLVIDGCGLEVAPGESIAVNGVCLTAETFQNGLITMSVMPESLRRSNLGRLRAGDAVNLERALTLNGRLGGHLVTGHVDAVGSVASIQMEGNALLAVVSLAADVMPFIAAKGSVALDGVSLTVASVSEGAFSVSLVEHTRRETTLAFLTPGRQINVEVDLIARYVRRLLEAEEPARARSVETDSSIDLIKWLSGDDPLNSGGV